MNAYMATINYCDYFFPFRNVEYVYGKTFLNNLFKNCGSIVKYDEFTFDSTTDDRNVRLIMSPKQKNEVL